MAQESRDRAAFDPRFDPAFQPGYDATQDPNSRARESGRRAASSPSAPAVDPSWRLSPPPVSPSRTTGAPAIPPVPVDATAARPAPADSADGPADAAASASSLQPVALATVRDLTRNPFVIALWALSVIFVIVGVGLLRWVSMAFETLNNSGDAGFDYPLVQALQVGGPQLIILGFAVATSTLLLFAVRWRAAPRD